MNQETIDALNRLNKEFYERHAEAFQTKRSRPWPGWERLLELFQSSVRQDKTRSKGPGHVTTILDAGCGHGRFAAFLDENLPGPLAYLGIDSSAALLEAAASRLKDTEGRTWRFSQADLLPPPDDQTPLPEPDEAGGDPPPNDQTPLPEPDEAGAEPPPNDRTPPPKPDEAGAELPPNDRAPLLEPDETVAGPPPGGLKSPGEVGRPGRAQTPGGGPATASIRRPITSIDRPAMASIRRPATSIDRPATASIRRPSLADRQCDLIVALGLLHHIPAQTQRHRLLHRLAATLAPGGLLALSFWQFGNRPRFERRVIPWEEHNRSTRHPIDPAELEQGDVLLAWGELGEGEAALCEAPRRYCHFAPPEEAHALAATLDLETIDTFRADGRDGDLNLYLALRRG